MGNALMFSAFFLITFLAWMSVIFHVVGWFLSDDVLFASVRSAVILYLTSGIVASVLTFMCCCLLGVLQVS